MCNTTKKAIKNIHSGQLAGLSCCIQHGERFWFVLLAINKAGVYCVSPKLMVNVPNCSKDRYGKCWFELLTQCTVHL